MRLADQVKGAAFGLGAAALFGLSAPLAKRLLAEMAPSLLAGLLYLGGGIALIAYRWLRPSAIVEAPLERVDLPTLVLVVVLGGVAGPLLMLFGLERTSGFTGSLLLNLEAPFTIAVAVLLFREHLGWRALTAMVLIVGGAAVLRIEQGTHRTDTLGVLLLAGACAAWAFDNNLTQRLSLRDPFAVVRVKALAAGTFNAALGLLLAGGTLPPAWAIGGALVLGAASYGASIVLDAYALRLLGAAREAAYFATAPFVGAIAATFVLDEAFGWVELGVMGLMALGVVLLLRERHSHEHAHHELEHSHVHAHDEHHRHEHGPNDPPGEPHAHPHRHAPLVHDHPHVPDMHHRHRH